LIDLKLGSRCVLALVLVAKQLGFAHAGALDEQIISKFAQTWEPVTKRLMEVDAEFDPQNLAGLVNQLEQMAKADGPDSARDHAVKPDGYADFETWAKTAASIVTCAQWAKDPPDAAEVETAIAAINADLEQTAEEKAALISDLKSALETAMKSKPDDADIETAKRLLPVLEPVLWQEE
jgi:hypothetical protein